MEKLVLIEILLIAWAVYLLFFIFTNLLLVFNREARSLYLEKVRENIEEYVTSEFMCKFFKNMFWLAVCVALLFAAFRGNITIG